jgi:hypothetical protein
MFREALSSLDIAQQRAEFVTGSREPRLVTPMVFSRRSSVRFQTWIRVWLANRMDVPPRMSDQQCAVGIEVLTASAIHYVRLALEGLRVAIRIPGMLHASPLSCHHPLIAYRCLYSDNVDGGRVLKGPSFTDTSSITQELCANYCDGQGLALAGLEYMQECCA